MNRLPILMYHNICIDESKSIGLTISENKLEHQLRYLSENNFESFHFSELKSKTSLPKKAVVLTFDDVTESQIVLAIPLLEKHNLKATFFIPFSYIGKTDLWNEGTKKIATLEQLKKINSPLIAYGYHSFEHTNFSKMTNEEVQIDFEKCNQIILETGLNVIKTFAYPYGKYPKKGVKNQNFKNTLKENNIDFGLKIGNRVNRFPFKDNYEIKRIDIKGEDSLLKFKIKLRIGKLKLF